MTPQTVTIRIPRKANERIQFSKELYDQNPQEWECETRMKQNVRLLCTDRKSDRPIVGLRISCNGFEIIENWTNNGEFTNTESCYDLFMRRKSDEKLPDCVYWNVYPRGTVCSYRTQDDAESMATHSRIALIHVTYAWEDEK